MRNGREDPKRPRWQEEKTPSRRQVRVAKQKRTEKKLRVPLERRTPPKGVGRGRESRKSKGPERAPKALLQDLTSS